MKANRVLTEGTNTISKDLKLARSRWAEASDRAAELGTQLFQQGSGYGDPDARYQDEHTLDLARREAERLHQQYVELGSERMEDLLLKIQISQKRATWASFAVAAVVGLATIATSVIALIR